MTEWRTDAECELSLLRCGLSRDEVVLFGLLTRATRRLA